MLDLQLNKFPLWWRLIERNGVSNHQPHDCCATIYSGADQRKHQSSESLAFVWVIHWWLVNFPHKGPITRKMFLFDDVIMYLMGITCMHFFNVNLFNYRDHPFDAPVSRPKHARRSRAKISRPEEPARGAEGDSSKGRKKIYQQISGLD